MHAVELIDDLKEPRRASRLAKTLAGKILLWKLFVGG